jgi:glutaminyl-peptide cyclotransferase
MLLTIALVTLVACERHKKIDDSVNEPPKPVAPVGTASVLHAYPHDTAAFTQGLLWHGGYLYESTGREQHSTLRKVELETGKVLEKTDVAPQYFAEGLALLGDKLYQLTWQNQMGFIYGLSDFKQQGTFAYQGEGWGLTTDGTSLILSDGSNQLRFIDPSSYRVTRTISVMDGTEFVNDINELEWVKGEVWANVWHTDRIARIDPQTGKVKAWVDLTGLLDAAQHPDPEAVLNGIAYDAEHDRLFVTGKLWPTLFEIDVPGVAGGGGAAASAAAPAAPAAAGGTAGAATDTGATKR